MKNLLELFGHGEGSSSDIDPIDYCDFRKVGRLGMPTKPSCSAYDRDLGLLMLGTSEGHLHFLGGGHAHWVTILPKQGTAPTIPQLIFAVEGKATAMVITNMGKIFRVHITGDELVVKEVNLDERWKPREKPTLLQDSEEARLLIGTSSGNVHAINVKSLETTEFIPYSTVQIQDSKLPEVNEIKFIVAGPDGKHVAIVYGGNILVIFNTSTNEKEHVIEIPDLEGIHWSHTGTLFLTMKDGYYMDYTLAGGLGNLFSAYSPFPATPIKHITSAKTNAKDDEICIFTDGLPTALIGDRHCFTIMTAAEVKKSFEVGSKILNIFVSRENKESDKLDSGLVVVTKEEIIFLDIRKSHGGYQVFEGNPFFPFQANDVSCSFFAADLTEQLWERLHMVAKKSANAISHESGRDHPLRAFRLGDSDRNPPNAPFKRQVLLTGHDDGTVHVFAVGEKCPVLLFKIETRLELHEPGRDDMAGPMTDCPSSQHDSVSQLSDLSKSLSAGDFEDDIHDDDDPIRATKIGVYDGGCEDPDFSVLKMTMDPTNGMITVGTRLGVVIIYELCEERSDLFPAPTTVAVVANPEKYPTVAMKPYSSRLGNRTYLPGYQPIRHKSAHGSPDTSVFIQLEPRQPITAVDYLSSRGLVAMANESGFVIYDTKMNQVKITDSFIDNTYVPSDSSARRLTMRFKKSLRYTFRQKSRPNSNNTTLNADPNQSGSHDDSGSSTSKPVERRIEARPTAQVDFKPYQIRTLAFVNAPTDNGQLTDMLWVGLAGCLHSYHVVDVPQQGELVRKARSIIMKHIQSPIQKILFYNEFYKGSQQPRMVVLMDEEMRIYSFDALSKAKFKVRIASDEGYLYRRGQIVTLHNKSDPATTATFIVTSLNNGQIRVYSTNPDKKKKPWACNVISHTDNVAQLSLLISPAGDLFYFRPCQWEYQRATISSHSIKWQEPFARLKWSPLFA